MEDPVIVIRVHRFVLEGKMPPGIGADWVLLL